MRARFCSFTFTLDQVYLGCIYFVLFFLMLRFRNFYIHDLKKKNVCECVTVCFFSLILLPFFSETKLTDLLTYDAISAYCYLWCFSHEHTKPFVYHTPAYLIHTHGYGTYWEHTKSIIIYSVWSYTCAVLGMQCVCVFVNAE